MMDEGYNSDNLALDTLIYADQINDLRKRADEILYSITKHCPCDKCQNSRKCKQEELACKRFVKWCIGKPGRLDKFSQEPNKELYDALMYGA